MAQIADADAVLVARVLPQHQAALTLVQTRLSVPGVTEFYWLDLACGRGQILRFLDKNLSPQARSKIRYYGFDIDNDFARSASQTAEKMGLGSNNMDLGDITKFDRIIDNDLTFDFITLTNSIHEVSPSALSTLLVDCICRLKPSGTLFVYDMERITPPELGAVPWMRDDIERVIFFILDKVGATDYRPEIGQWRHSSCNGWNIQIARQHLPSATDTLRTALVEAIPAISDTIEKILHDRLLVCVGALEAITKYGIEAVEEEGEKLRLLNEFWSLSRALEHLS